MRCDQPGCPGQIVDGYCDVCGLPPRSAPAVASGGARSRGVPGSAPARTPSGPCRQPGCPGQIVDGYCDVCGNPPTAAPAPRPGPGPGTGATAAAASQNLASAAIGSVLAPDRSKRPRPGTLHRATTRIGAGLTTVPPAPLADPEKQLMKNPVVPEEKRFCPNCGEPIGRSIENQPGRLKGFCPSCQAAYNFEPSIRAGEVVAGQYEVAGAIAYGGMGWIYLARDKNVSDRWVVLKGLLNAGDHDAKMAALSEQEFLAQVEHPLIVEIYNFVTGTDGARYIVMEYVPGVSLKQLLKQRMIANGGVMDPLPVDWALAYIIEVLPAFTYLHDRGLLYCDFKPDNVMQVGDSVKLIDLGGVRHIDDDTSPMYGTVGFQAPELALRGASVPSDLYTVGRTLLVLSTEFRGYQGEYATSLPPLADLKEIAGQDSLYRLVLRCCAPNPDDRFQSAEELRQQALGVLREVVGQKARRAAYTSAPSPLFEPPTQTGDAFHWSQLPKLRPDPTDPMFDWLSQLPVMAPAERLAALKAAPEQTPEVLLEQIRVVLGAGDRAAARRLTQALLALNPWDWRAVWMDGVAALMANDNLAAQPAFNAVYGQVPGELAPKYALAIACERGGQPATAEQLYLVCATTDANYVTPAAFGLARLRSSRGDLAGTLEALNLIPSTSRGYTESRRLRAQHLMALGSGLGDLAQALDAVAAARLDPPTYARYAVEILSRALDLVRTHGDQPTLHIGGQPATDRAIRPLLEQAYRDLAAYETNPGERARLIEQANATRRWSLL
nr:protein kinase [Propionibacterium sp.]